MQRHAGSGVGDRLTAYVFGCVFAVELHAAAVEIDIERRSGVCERRLFGDRNGAGATWIQSAPAVTLAPTLASSVAIAAMRSVSLTRQLPIFTRRIGAAANSAVTASVIAASGMAAQSSTPPRSGAPARASMKSFPKPISAPCP